MNQILDEFYFRWLGNSLIEIEKPESIPYLFNHLKRNLPKIIEIIKP